MDDPKTELRAHARDTRNRLMPTLEDAEAASRLFFEVMSPRPGAIIAAYWPKGKEFDSRVIIDDCLKQGLKVALPVLPKTGRAMIFRQWCEGEPLVNNSFNIPEPQDGAEIEPDIVLVPFLAFDRRGYRLGYGGGHYDATLAALRARKEITAIGIGYGEQAVLFNLPVEEHDEKLDMVITPQSVFDYR